MTGHAESPALVDGSRPGSTEPTRNAGPAIRIRDLVMSYGETRAVDGLDLEIADGEMLVLLGPSGCGKTTTMRCVAGLETPVEGTIEIGGSRAFDSATGHAVAPNKRDVGMVFQSYAIWPHKTVFQNVAFPLRMKSVPRAEIAGRVEEMLALVGLEGFASRGASDLSGGQMQRVALARSLVMRPRVLLLDEPLSNLDAKLRERLRFELKEIQQSLRVTSIYVTHDQTEALALADRIAVMSAGRIAQLDVPQGLYERPASAFVADFMGYTNIWPARVLESTEDGATVRLLDEDLTVGSVASGWHTGAEVSVGLRPEAVMVADGHPTSPAANTWAGEVAVASYLGTHIRYRVRLLAGPVLEVVSHRTQAIRPTGAMVTVSISPADVTVLGS